MNAWLLAALLAPPVAAQDAEAMALDTILVSDVDAPPRLRDAADRVHRGLVDVLDDEHLLYAMSDVPPFKGYDASIYLSACPVGRHADCAWVVGQRVGADWVLASQLDEVDGILELEVSWIDVDTATVVLVVPMQLESPGDRASLANADVLFHAILAGQVEPVDLRIDVEGAPTGEEVDPATLRAAAEELEAWEEEAGEVDRGEVDLRRRRLTSRDLDRYDGADETPWDRVGLTRAQYLYVKNRRIPLSTFRERARGRRGEILVGLSAFQLGSGPWTQIYEGWYALDSELEVSEQYVLHDQTRGPLRSWELSLGGGILPWLDASVFGGPRLSTYRWRVQRVVEGDELLPADPDQKLVTTWHVGARVGFAPLPARIVRPVASVGALWWIGSRRERLVEANEALDTLPPNQMWLLQVTAGAEVSVARWLNLWARAELEVPLVQNFPSEIIKGGTLLAGRPTADPSDEGVSIAGALGATVRIRLRPKDVGGSPAP